MSQRETSPDSATLPKPRLAQVVKYIVKRHYALARIKGCGNRFVLIHMTKCRHTKNCQFSDLHLNLTPCMHDIVVFITDPRSTEWKPRASCWGYYDHWKPKK